MSQFYVPGPSLIYTGTGSSGALEFLGFSERETEHVHSAAFDDIYADYAGPAVPADVQFAGIQAFVTMTLTRYNEAVLNKVTQRIPGSAAGAIAAATLGTLMVSEQAAFELLIVSAYNSKAFFSTMNPCYDYGACWLHDDYRFGLGTRAKRPQFTFRCVPVWNPVTLAATLFTTTLPGTLPPAN